MTMATKYTPKKFTEGEKSDRRHQVQIYAEYIRACGGFATGPHLCGLPCGIVAPWATPTDQSLTRSIEPVVFQLNLATQRTPYFLSRSRFEAVDIVRICGTTLDLCLPSRLLVGSSALTILQFASRPSGFEGSFPRGGPCPCSLARSLRC